MDSTSVKLGSLRTPSVRDTGALRTLRALEVSRVLESLVFFVTIRPHWLKVHADGHAGERAACFLVLAPDGMNKMAAIDRRNVGRGQEPGRGRRRCVSPRRRPDRGLTVRAG